MGYYDAAMDAFALLLIVLVVVGGLVYLVRRNSGSGTAHMSPRAATVFKAGEASAVFKVAVAAVGAVFIAVVAALNGAWEPAVVALALSLIFAVAAGFSYRAYKRRH